MASYVSIGDSMSPADVRQGDIIRFIVARRAAGASDLEILAQLQSDNVTRSHPCADISGTRNICTADEISDAMARAKGVVNKGEDGVVPPRKSIQGGSKSILIVGGLAATILFLSRRKK